MFHSRLPVFFTAFLIMAVTALPVFPVSVIGEYSASSGGDYSQPVLSGVTENFTTDSVLTLSGARLKLLSGTVITPSDMGQEGIVLELEKGAVSFRIFPQTNVYTFSTPLALIKTPRVVKSSEGVIEGHLKVSENGETELQVTRGELQVVSSEGIRKAGENEVVKIARADNPEKNSDHYTPPGNSEEQDAGGNGTALPPSVIATGVVTAGVVTGIVFLIEDDDGSSSPIEP